MVETCLCVKMKAYRISVFYKPTLVSLFPLKEELLINITRKNKTVAGLSFPTPLESNGNHLNGLRQPAKLVHRKPYSLNKEIMGIRGGASPQKWGIRLLKLYINPYLD